MRSYFLKEGGDQMRHTFWLLAALAFAIAPYLVRADAYWE